MLKKLYFHTSKGRSYDFDITGTIKVDKPEFTKWVVEVDPNNELDTWVVVATTDDCTFDIVGDDSLIIWELPPVEETKDPDIWTVNIEKTDFTFLTIEGRYLGRGTVTLRLRPAMAASTTFHQTFVSSKLTMYLRSSPLVTSNDSHVFRIVLV